MINRSVKRTFFSRFLCLYSLFALSLALPACSSDPTIVAKNFECEGHDECAPAEVCEKGKCVKSDDDKDGWSGKRGDCNDKNASVYPGAPEVCGNQIDDNCDGKTDEAPCNCQDGTERECGIDVGECQKGKQQCKQGVWQACDAPIGPQKEVCNGKDDDCDGTVDEKLADCCKSGTTQECGVDEGECKKGTQTCTDGKWSDCNGGIQPQQEDCNGKDDDCDGKIDNNVRGQDDPLQKTCYSGPKETRGVGLCKDGVLFCNSGQWSTKCEKDETPKAEECDGKDNDCDGKIDNVKGKDQSLQKSCYSGDPKTKGKGACKEGIQRCAGGQWTGCQGEVSPVAETCNGVDDDCDGKVDNANGGKTGQLSKSCYTGKPGTEGKGICKSGLQFCDNGRWLPCKDEVIPTKEDCNNKDDDCDGKVDEPDAGQTSLGGECYSGPKGTAGQGPCRKGQRQCVKGQWTKCTGEVAPQAEKCDNKDNDCDGKIDNFKRPCYDVPQGCSAQSDGSFRCVGICRAGIQTCSQGSWGICQNQVFPKNNETCNGVDDNCNGSVDEGNPGAGGACTVTKYPSGTPCRAGERRCSQGRVQCVQTVQPKTEVCNGKDDNCNGKIDDGISGVGSLCFITRYNTRAPCRNGRNACSGGRVICRQTVFPKTEICNSIDDNCDGLVDNNACGRGTRCSSNRCIRCTQPSNTKCSTFLGICTRDARDPRCTCGLRPTCIRRQSFPSRCKEKACR